MSANATPKQLERLTDFGQIFGLAFQVIDDILDVTQTTEKLGKSKGSGHHGQKATIRLRPPDQAKKEPTVSTSARAPRLGLWPGCRAA